MRTPEFTSKGCHEITGRGTCYSVKNPGGYPEPGVLTGTVVMIDNSPYRVKGVESFRIARPYPDSLDFALLAEKVCCKWDHVRPCGPVLGNPIDGEPICACGCSGYDERCGGYEWWLPFTAESTVSELTRTWCLPHQAFRGEDDHHWPWCCRSVGSDDCVFVVYDDSRASS